MSGLRIAVRVVIADAQPVLRRGLRAVLTAEPGVDVVSEAGTGRDAVRETLLHRPDVLLLDLNLPELDGYATTERVRQAAPGTAVVALTADPNDRSMVSAIRAGVHGYLHKGADQDGIARAVLAAAAGEAIFGSGIADRIVALIALGSDNRPFPQLTPREREVLGLVGAGLPNAAIARRLHMAHKTVCNHVSAISTKLRVAGRSEVHAAAREAGFGRLRSVC